MTENYEPNEKDIDSMIRFLKIDEPENATREQAIAKLKDLKAGVDIMSYNNPDRLEKLHEELKENKHSSEE